MSLDRPPEAGPAVPAAAEAVSLPAAPEPRASGAASPAPGGPGARGWPRAEALAERRLQTICLLVLAVIASGTAAWWLRDVLVPFVFAIFLSVVLHPLVELQVRRLRLPHGLAVASTLAVGILVLAALAGLVSASVVQLTGNGPAYQARVQELLTLALDRLPLQRLGIDPARMIDYFSETPAEAMTAMVRQIVEGLVSLVSHGTVVLIYLLFLLLGSAVGLRREGVWGQIRQSIERYIQVKTVISLLVGALTWLFLNVLGVPLALVFGLLAFLLNFIPNVGPILATLLPLPVAFLNPSLGLGAAVLAIALPGLVHFVVGHLLEPRILGESLELDPVVVLLALMFFGAIWGPIGMLLATPLTAVARILLGRVALTRPLAAALAGRGGGTDHEAGGGSGGSG